MHQEEVTLHVLVIWSIKEHRSQNQIPQLYISMTFLKNLSKIKKFDTQVANKWMSYCSFLPIKTSNVSMFSNVLT